MIGGLEASVSTSSDGLYPVRTTVLIIERAWRGRGAKQRRSDGEGRARVYTALSRVPNSSFHKRSRSLLLPSMHILSRSWRRMAHCGSCGSGSSRGVTGPVRGTWLRASTVAHRVASGLISIDALDEVAGSPNSMRLVLRWRPPQLGPRRAEGMSLRRQPA